VYVFARDASGCQAAHIKASIPISDFFGLSVALSGDVLP
jgi:hypothetical protein